MNISENLGLQRVTTTEIEVFNCILKFSYKLEKHSQSTKDLQSFRFTTVAS